MKKLIMLRGLPGSGKSTWAKAQVTGSPNSYKRINKDDLRSMLDCGHWSRDAEKFIVSVRDILITASLADGKHVLVDDTNFAPVHEARLRQLARENGAVFEIKDFDTPLDECIANDLKRLASVGEKVIRKMYDQYLRKAATPPVFDSSLPTAIICDLDGTLAHLNGRNPYDASTCEYDKLSVPVAAILTKFSATAKVVFVSGRTDEYYNQTEAWLLGYGISYYEALFMRPTGDTRKDAIVKEEIYHREIEGKYNVLFVLDDRNQVVDMWRSLGLTCLQVAEGNF